MEHAEKTFAEHVARRLEALGTNAFAFERANGLPADAVRSILRGGKKSGTTLNKAREVCDALGLEFYIGPRRDPDAPPPPPIEVDGQEFATVPRVEAEASAGHGVMNGEAVVIGAMAFRKEWLRDRGIQPDKALLVKVTGDSMEPRIAAGDLVLVDLAQIQIDNGQPYIFTDVDGETRLKRLHRLGSRTLALVSDNTAYPTELRDGIDAERVKVIGRIAWSGHTWD